MFLRRAFTRHPSVLTILLTTLAASDLAYRLLLRASVRRAIGLVSDGPARGD